MVCHDAGWVVIGDFIAAVSSGRNKSIAVLMSDDAFGYLGSGGSLGFADAGCRMSFGYSMNKQGNTIGLDARGQALVDAVYRALGYRQVAGCGIWVR